MIEGSQGKILPASWTGVAQVLAHDKGIEPRIGVWSKETEYILIRDFFRVQIDVAECRFREGHHGGYRYTQSDPMERHGYDMEKQEESA